MHTLTVAALQLDRFLSSLRRSLSHCSCCCRRCCRFRFQCLLQQLSRAEWDACNARIQCVQCMLCTHIVIQKLSLCGSLCHVFLWKKFSVCARANSCCSGWLFFTKKKCASYFALLAFVVLASGVPSDSRGEGGKGRGRRKRSLLTTHGKRTHINFARRSIAVDQRKKLNKEQKEEERGEENEKKDKRKRRRTSEEYEEKDWEKEEVLTKRRRKERTEPEEEEQRG